MDTDNDASGLDNLARESAKSRSPSPSSGRTTFATGRFGAGWLLVGFVVGGFLMGGISVSIYHEQKEALKYFG